MAILCLICFLSRAPSHLLATESPRRRAHPLKRCTDGSIRTLFILATLSIACFLCLPCNQVAKVARQSRFESSVKALADLLVRTLHRTSDLHPDVVTASLISLARMSTFEVTLALAKWIPSESGTRSTTDVCLISLPAPMSAQPA